MKRVFRLSKSFFNRSFLQVVVAGLFLGFFVYFMRNEQIDIAEIKLTLGKASPLWISIGLLVTLAYLALQATLYIFSFKSIGVTIDFKSALTLFLKRNFISPFLPAGSLTSLAFFSDELSKFKLQRAQIYYGSFLFVLASITSVVLICIPVTTFLFLQHHLRSIEFYGVWVLAVLVVFFYTGYGIIRRKGFPFTLINQVSPRFVTQITTLKNYGFRSTFFLKACVVSMLIEFAGVIYLYIALASMGLQPSWEVAVIGYVIMIVISSLSPFFRGLGAIEVSVAYVLTLYGYAPALAASVTLLFRLFEFWLPFVISIAAFLLNRGNLLLRVFPSIFILLLGVVNILSTLTPAIPERLHLLRDFIPLSIMEFSNIAVLLMGIAMVISSAFLLTGAKNAWKMALGVSFISLILHLTKALDYEEALVALVCLGILWHTRRAYFVKYNITFQLKSLQKVMLLGVALFTYSVAGFYFLQVRHLDFDFTLIESFTEGVKAIVLMTGDLHPLTRTGHFFIYSVQMNSILFMTYGLVLLYRASKTKTPVSDDDFQTAGKLLSQCGRSSMDYFKLYPDKKIFFNEGKDAFLAYSESKHYAVVLESPVAANPASASQLLLAFEEFCSEKGLRTFYYRVPEEDLYQYFFLKKKSILLGQEAIVNLATFSLEGSAKKAMRNAVNRVEKAGYQFKIYPAPLKDGLVQQLKAVSNEWLQVRGHDESGFSQGVFHGKEIKKCTVLTVENRESKILAFLNIVPSYKKGEVTYDLIRQSNDSPNGVLDYLIIRMIAFLRENKFRTLNMGLAPLAGLQGVNLNEQVMQFYKDHFKEAIRLRGLFEYKNKFDPCWENRYLVYDQTFDLVHFPAVLRKVSQADRILGI